MATSFVLKNQPGRDLIASLKKRYKDVDVSALETYKAVLSLASRLRESADAFLGLYGASQGKASLLVHLSAQDSLTPSELSNRCGVTRATVTGLLDGLEREGLVHRGRPGRDRRCVAVRLTAKGRRLVDEFLPPHCRRISAVLSCLSEGERKTVIALLAKVAAAAEEPSR